MTSKECLKRIDEKNYLTEREHKEFLSVIEKNLDRLEKLEIENDELKRINGAYQESNIVFQDLIKKFTKFIEILKTKIKMEPYHLPKSRYYHFYIGGRIVLLSREEYLLLKEVLECQKD